MYYSSAYRVDFGLNGKLYYDEVKSGSSEDAKTWIRNNYRGAEITQVRNLTREDAIKKVGDLVLLEIPIHADKNTQKFIKTLITSFIAVADTEYHLYVKNYPTDSLKGIAKRVFKQMTGGNKSF